MANQTNSSAGVYTSEEDRSQRIRAASTSIGAFVGAAPKGPVNKRVLVTDEADFLDKFGLPDPRISYLHYCAIPFLNSSTRAYVTRVVNNALTAGCYVSVDDVSAIDPVITLTNFDGGSSQARGKIDPFNTLGFDPTTPGVANLLGFFCAENPGVWNNGLYIRIRPNIKAGVTTPDDPYTFWVEVFLNYQSAQQRPNEAFLVSWDKRLDGFSRQLNIFQVINSKSSLIRWVPNPYASTAYKVMKQSSVFLDGGTNGDPVTDGQIMLGWDLYTDPESVDVNIMVNGGYCTPAVQAHIDHIARSRQDASPVLDIPNDKQQVGDAMNYALNDLNIDSSYSALYAPWVRVYDKYSDRIISVPPSGFVAAAYARTDNNHAVWFAPAGMENGSLDVRGVDVRYNQNARDALDSAHLNMIRVFPGKGYKIWAAETLQSEASSLSNVNVRRLLNYLKKSISLAMLYSVFDPNDPILWAKLTEMCERFLKPIRNAGGLYWFAVECSAINNTAASIGTGDVHLDVYFDPVLPAKRIHLNAIITRTGQVYKEMAADRNK